MNNKIIESILKDAMGLNISSIGQNSLKNALGRRMKSLGIDNEFAYLTKLKSSSQEMNTLIDEVAVNETWFFRDDAPFTALSHFAKNWLKNNPNCHLRILSIPCSTGEEPYSIAISLIEAGISENFFNIDAVDISTRSLEVAKKALYRDRSFRGLSNRIKKLYFTKTSDGYQLNENIKKGINFFKGNLINFNLPVTSRVYNAIFCRNLLIYFDSSFHSQAIGTLYKLLSDDGLLFIGHAEAGLFIESDFTSAPYPKTFSYYKSEHAKTLELINVQKNYLTGSKNNFSSTNTEKADPINNLTEQNLFIDELFEARRHKETGNYEKAINLCEIYIKKNGASAQVFYLLGCIFVEQFEFKNAVKMLKKSVYLNPDFIDAIDLLASIYQRLGDMTNSDIYLKRASRVKERLRKSL